jgi:hypothetical protein
MAGPFCAASLGMGLAGLVAMGLGGLSLLATVWMKARFGTFMTGNPFLRLCTLLGLLGGMRTCFESQCKTAYAVRTDTSLIRRAAASSGAACAAGPGGRC